MTPGEHEDMTLKHEQILSGTDGQKGNVEKVEELYKWFHQNKGRNSVIANIKDILISGGILAIVIGYFLN